MGMIDNDDFLRVLTQNTLPKCGKYDNSIKDTVHYYNVPFGFDIETTSTYAQSEKFAFMYEWTIGVLIEDKPYITYGRDWDGLLSLLTKMIKILGVTPTNRIVIYVHNLSYEFQFCRKYFDWLKVFAVDERKPITALTAQGVEFRDSYILSGYSLAKTAKNLTTHKIKKLVGDLDYKLVRTPKTPLTDKELEYCNNDVEIVLYYIAEQINQYADLSKIPLTNTGRVRTFCRNNCLHSAKSHRKDSVGKKNRYRELMRELSLTADDYLQLHQTFMGGFTHASMLHSGETLEKVSSYDFTSSYPYVMLSEKFPMSRPIPVENVSHETFKKMVEDEETGLIFVAKFINLRSKITFESYLSESKCKLSGGIINNGRVYSADICITSITDVDFRIIRQCYEWDTLEVANIKKFYMEYLPKGIIESIVTLYEKKTTLKGVEGMETEYLLSKGMLNSVYGMCVTAVLRDNITYADDWGLEKVNPETAKEQIESYNTSKKRFLYYAWGVWVTAYARLNLWSGILNCKDDFVYADTDSIKILNGDKHIDYIKWYNRNTERKLQKMCEFRKIDYRRLKPRTIKGVEKPIGVWDFEGEYSRFKTLGAKRYLYTDSEGKNYLTCAGLSKQNGLSYMEKMAKDKKCDVYDLFTDELYIPADKTGKNTHTYIDTPQTYDVIDYLGNHCICSSQSSVHLSECEFTLSISKQYNKFLLSLRAGYLDTGDKML